MNPRTIRWLTIAALFGVTVGLVCCAVNGVDPNGLLSLLPVLLLSFALIGRRYPGEQLLLSKRYARRPRRRQAQIRAARPRPGIVRIARGGLLLGCALAVRPPPLTAAP